MIELLLASGLSCASSLELLNRVNEYSLRTDMPAAHIQEVIEDKWNRGLDIFIESVHKPDAALRQCAHNQKCYHELMDVRTEVLNHLKSLRWN